MGIFNFWKKRRGTVFKKNRDGQRKSQVGALEKTACLEVLFQRSASERDATWEQQVLQHIAGANFASADPELIQGADGFPYFVLKIPKSNHSHQLITLERIIPEYLIEQGVGVVLQQAHTAQVDWVFSYGDLVNFYLHGVFYDPQATYEPKPEKEVIREQENVLVGQPAESYLPVPTRKVLRAFLERQGIEGTRIALLSKQCGNEVRQELVCNLTPDKVGPDFYQVLRKRIQWFLPRHYTLIAMQEHGALGGDFKPL